jgi:hypothetical protein
VCIINKHVVHHTLQFFLLAMFTSNTREDCLHSNIPCNSYSLMTKETKMDVTILSILLFTMPARNIPILVIWVNVAYYCIVFTYTEDQMEYHMEDWMECQIRYCINVATANAIFMLSFRYDHWGLIIFVEVMN